MTSSCDEIELVQNKIPPPIGGGIYCYTPYLEAGMIQPNKGKLSFADRTNGLMVTLPSNASISEAVEREWCADAPARFE